MYPEELKKYIPPEFDLAKYKKTANMELIYWLDNLISRADLFEYYLVNDLTFGEDKRESENSANVFAAIANDELSSEEIFERDVINNLEQGAYINPNMLNYVDAMYVYQNKNTVPIVSNISFYHLLELRNHYITEDLEELYSKVEKSILPSAMVENLGVLNTEICSYNNDGKVDESWLKIDMNCTDKEIKSAFNDWLEQARLKQNKDAKQKKWKHKVKLLNETTFRKWHDSKVLAYIDIVTWNFLKQNKITYKIIGDILYPDPKNLADKAKMIEDTSHTYACQLTSSLFLTRMLKVALDKKTEEN